MGEKKYLNGFQKVGYASGQVASICGYALVTSFMMIYLTNTVGLNSAIVGTLMLVSRIFDGITDVFFGTMIDRTKSKMGKARPWMLYGQIGVSVGLFLLFSIPNMSQNMQYVYFFVFYTALNAVFYTATGIAYSALSALITRNAGERVQIGSIGGIFATITYMVVLSMTMGLVEGFGGGANGWRMVALIFAIVAFAFNTFSVLSVKELPDEENKEKKEAVKAEEKMSLRKALLLLVKNPYYLLFTAIFIVFYTANGLSSVTVYFCEYFFGDSSLQGIMSLAATVPMIVVVALTPVMVKKFGSIRKLCMTGYALSTGLGIFQVIALLLQKNIPLFLLFTFIRAIGTAPFTGVANALIAETADYTYRTQKVRLDGTMFSCSAMGVKIGGGIGSAIVGILLSVGGFDGTATVQTAGAVNMIFFIQMVLPILFGLVQFILLYFLKVEKANKDWDAAHKEMAQ